MRGRVWPLAAASAIAIASAAQAQPPVPPTITDIVADTGQLSLGTEVSAAGTVTTIAGGTRAGANLFHSFSRFDVGSGDTARFVAAEPAGIDNVISRVTGGQRSVVLGTIDSQALPNADFWFVNPAGIVFGPGARLDVPAAARFATSSELRFADAPAFAVTTPGGSTLSVASPIAFGFVGGEGNITVAGAGRGLLPDGGRLTLAGADVSLVDSNLAGGVFQLLGAGAQPLELLLADPLAAPLAGRVTVEGSTLRLDGAAVGTGGIRIGGGAVDILASDLGTARINGPDQGISGPITIQGASVSLLDSVVSASTFGPEPAAPILITGGDILIARSAVTNDARIGSTGEAGLIGIRSEQVRFETAFVTSSTQTAQGGGGIAIEAGRIVVGNGSLITSSSLEQATGDAGAIILAGGSLELSGGSAITSQTFGEGNAGAILVELARQILLDGSTIQSLALEGSSGDAGLIGIVAPELTLRNGAFISTDTFAPGAGGQIGIQVGGILVDEGSLISSGSDFGGDAGRIFIATDRLRLDNGGKIASDTLGSGSSGAIEIEAREILLDRAGGISSVSIEDCPTDNCAPSGLGGEIRITADLLRLTGFTELGSEATGISVLGAGRRGAGSVLLDLGKLEISGLAGIDGDTIGVGAGGQIQILADDIRLDSDATISASGNGGGGGGGIFISSDRLLLDDDSRITTNTIGTGEGGAIEIESGEVVLARGAAISSNATDLCSDPVCAPTGGSGNILITASRLQMIGFANFEGDATSIRTDGSGSRAAGSITLRLGTLDMSGLAGIEADNLGSGFGGLVDISARDIALRDSAFISTGSFDIGPGGDIAIEADMLLLEDEASIRSESSFRFGGPAGTILINAGSAVIRSSQITTSSQGDGDAGNIQILAARFEIDRANVTSSTRGSGRGGDVLINANDVVIRNDGSVASDSLPCFTICASSGDAGSVTVIADSLTMIGDEIQSIITSRTLTDGDAGDIIVRVGRLDMNYGAMSSSTVSSGDAGRIDIEAGEISLTTFTSITSRAVPFLPDPSVQGGNAGSIRIASTGAITLSGDSLISTQTDGNGNAGTIDIAAPSLVLRERATITSATFAGGAGGLIDIRAGDILVDGFSSINSQASENATTNAGQVTIRADRLALTNGGSISSDTAGTAIGGGIEIEAGEVNIASDGRITSDSTYECVAEPCNSAGNAGNISITADILRIRGSEEFGGAPSRAISSDTSQSGQAGSIGLVLGTLDMAGLAFVSSDTLGSGAGGQIDIVADSVLLRNGAFISTSTTGGGAGGAIFVDAGSLLIEDDASIRSQSLSPAGAPGGLIVVDSGSTVIRRAEINSSGLGNGDAGSIELRGGRLELDLGTILSDTQGAGRGGDIRIDADAVVLRNGSLIAADSLGCFAAACESLGDAGSVTITAASLTMTGTDDPELGLQLSRITSETATEGKAGDIVIDVGRLAMDIAGISSGTRGLGDAGTIDIEADQVDIANFSQIETRSQPFCPDGVCDPVGNAGSIRIAAAGAVSLSAFSAIASNTFGNGDAGAIAIEADSLTLQRARITTASEIGATGSAGNIAVDVAGTLRIADGSELSSEASNASPAGAILVEAGRVRIEDPNSAISSANNEQGSAGAVLIFAGALDLIEGGRISTSSNRGAAGDIGIVMPEASLLRLTGRRFVSTITTSSGPGTGGRIAITNPYAIISDGGSILALGEQGGANVQIQSGFFIRSADRVNRVAVDGDFLLEAQAGDVSSGTVERDLSILDASGVLRGQCAATRATGQVSQLVVRPVGPYGRGGAAVVRPPCE